MANIRLITIYQSTKNYAEFIVNYSLITIQFYAELMDNDWASLHKSGMVSFFKTASIYKR